MEINPLFKDYIKKAENITPEEALDTLIAIYINACGISLGERTVARYSAEYWILRYHDEHPERPESMKFKDIMALRSEEYRQDKERIDEYTCYCADPRELLRITIEMLYDYEDENTRIAISVGIFWFLAYLAEQVKSGKEQRE